MFKNYLPKLLLIRLAHITTFIVVYKSIIRSVCYVFLATPSKITLLLKLEFILLEKNAIINVFNRTLFFIHALIPM